MSSKTPALPVKTSEAMENFQKDPNEENFKALEEKKTKTVEELRGLATLYHQGFEKKDFKIEKDEKKTKACLETAIKMNDLNSLFDYAILFESQPAAQLSMLTKVKNQSTNNSLKSRACSAAANILFVQKKYQLAFEELKMAKTLGGRDVELSIAKVALVLINQKQNEIHEIIQSTTNQLAS